MDRGVWQATAQRVAESRTRLKRLNMQAHTPYHRAGLRLEGRPQKQVMTRRICECSNSNIISSTNILF